MPVGGGGHLFYFINFTDLFDRETGRESISGGEQQAGEGETGMRGAPSKDPGILT